MKVDPYYVTNFLHILFIRCRTSFRLSKPALEKTNVFADSIALSDYVAAMIKLTF